MCAAPEGETEGGEEGWEERGGGRGGEVEERKQASLVVVGPTVVGFFPSPNLGCAFFPLGTHFPLVALCCRLTPVSSGDYKVQRYSI